MGPVFIGFEHTSQMSGQHKDEIPGKIKNPEQFLSLLLEPRAIAPNFYTNGPRKEEFKLGQND
jgi:hypothetical protein